MNGRRAKSLRRLALNIIKDSIDESEPLPFHEELFLFSSHGGAIPRDFVWSLQGGGRLLRARAVHVGARAVLNAIKASPPDPSETYWEIYTRVHQRVTALRRVAAAAVKGKKGRLYRL